MDGIPKRRERTEELVSDGDSATNPMSIPPVEDLFDVDTDPTDFMSVQSFPASDPPPMQRVAEIVEIAHRQTAEKSEVSHAPPLRSTWRSCPCTDQPDGLCLLDRNGELLLMRVVGREGVQSARRAAGVSDEYLDSVAQSLRIRG